MKIKENNILKHKLIITFNSDDPNISEKALNDGNMLENVLKIVSDSKINKVLYSVEEPKEIDHIGEIPQGLKDHVNNLFNGKVAHGYFRKQLDTTTINHGVTIAVGKTKEGNILLGVSVTHLCDHFCYNTGRLLAYRKLSAAAKGKKYNPLDISYEAILDMFIKYGFNQEEAKQQTEKLTSLISYVNSI